MGEHVGDNLAVICSHCGHHHADHLDDDGRVGSCGYWIPAVALVHICTCPGFVPLTISTTSKPTPVSVEALPATSGTERAL